MNAVCNICGSQTSKIFDAVLLKKYQVAYLQCTSCQFIQTEKPYWLGEAYTSAMTSIDVGLVFRNVHFSNTLPAILDFFSEVDDSFLDYGGGYGMFVRMMRDKGYDFYLYDKYAQNLFARYFEIENFSRNEKFKGLTAFEVFEHLDHPMEEIQKMLSLSDTIIFSTELQPQPAFQQPADWWYFMPEVGQHIAFYSRASLAFIAGRFNCRIYSNGTNLHIFTRQPFSADPFNLGNPGQHNQSLFSRIKRKLAPIEESSLPTRTSLLAKDFELYKSLAFKEETTANDPSQHSS